MNSAEVKESSIYFEDSVKIQTLIRQMLKWAISNRTFKLLPTLSKDSFCVGFDPKRLKHNIALLKNTGFFEDEFMLTIKR